MDEMLPNNEGEPEWSGEELEAAYLRALEALEAVESEIVATNTELQTPAVEEAALAPASPVAAAPSEPAEPAPAVLHPRQVIEACLFVGGATLTAQRLAGLLRGTATSEFVEQTLAEINEQYRDEGRPYSIVLGEGGYRFQLTDEFERIRHKVYGIGPREVRLSQEVLEILALVAYRQPVTEEELAELGRPNSNPTLRQLIRRDLVVVERDTENPKQVRYRTTPRFLSVFGLRSVEDLPRPEDLAFK